MGRNQLVAFFLVLLLLVINLIGVDRFTGPSTSAEDEPSLSLRAVVVGVNEVDLIWSGTLDPRVAYVQVMRDGLELAVLDPGTVTYVDGSVTESNRYVYVVEMRDALSNVLGSSLPITVTTPDHPELPDTVPPSPPQDLAVRDTDGALLLSWNAAQDDTGVTAYRIYRDDLIVMTVDGTTLNYLDDDVDKSVDHFYAVEALDRLGQSSEAATFTAIAGTTGRPTPTPIKPGPFLADEPGPHYNPQLLRYPYLTDVVDRFATVNWATDRSSTSGTIRWGEVGADGACNLTETAEATRTAHVINGVGEYLWKVMLELESDTQYCYRVYLGNVDLLGLDPSPTFWTQVAAGSTKPFSFVVFGDWGGTDDNGENPDQANLMQLIAASGARFALTVGDNGFPVSNQKSAGDLVQNGPGESGIFGPAFWALPGRSIPIFPSLGNHDFISATGEHPFFVNWPQDRAVDLSQGTYEPRRHCCANETQPESYPAAWYAFSVGNARFYVLTAAWSDSNLGTGGLYKNDYDAHWTPDSEQYQWLENDLKNHPDQLKFAVFHFPLYADHTVRSSDPYLQGEQSLEGLLGRYGVNFAFSGHVHQYERNHPNADGLVTYVTGGGGDTLTSVNLCRPFDAYAIGWSQSSGTGNSCNAPIPTSEAEVHHFLLVTVDGHRVTVTPTSSTGRTFDVVTYTFNDGTVTLTP